MSRGLGRSQPCPNKQLALSSHEKMFYNIGTGPTHGSISIRQSIYKMPSLASVSLYAVKEKCARRNMCTSENVTMALNR